MFEIRELRHLLSIDEFRHFGQAAKAVGLSQPALTKSLQRMEHALGARLFERSRARVEPTPIGVVVLARSRQLVADADELKRTVDGLTGAENGSVTVGVGPAMAETYVVDAIAAIAQEHPHTQITVRVDHWQQLSEWLVASELDFYVADVGEARVDRRFAYVGLPPQQFVWFCRPAHPLARRRNKRITRNDLLRFPIATPRMPPWATEWFAAALGDQGAAGLPRPFPAVECESYAMLKRIISQSDCISAALEQTLASEVKARAFVILDVEAPELSTRAGIIHLAKRTPSPLASQLMACITEHASGRTKRGA